jgi:hypothetical protein
MERYLVFGVRVKGKQLRPLDDQPAALYGQTVTREFRPIDSLISDICSMRILNAYGDSASCEAQRDGYRTVRKCTGRNRRLDDEMPAISANTQDAREHYV